MCCEDITSIVTFEKTLNIENFKLQMILKKMEYHSWIAQSNNIIVRTIPFQNFNTL